MGNTTSTQKPDGHTTSGGSVSGQPRNSTSRRVTVQAPASGTPSPGPERSSRNSYIGSTTTSSSETARTRKSLNGAGYHSKRSLEFPDFQVAAHMSPAFQRVASTVPSAPIPIPVGAAAPIRLETVRPINHDSASMQDLVLPAGGHAHPGAGGANARPGHYGPLPPTESNAHFESSAARGPGGGSGQQQQHQPPPVLPRLPTGPSGRSGSSLGFGARGPRGKILTNSVPANSHYDVVQSSVPMGLQSTDIKLGALEPGANQMELPTLITWTPDKSTLAPTVEQPKQPNPNQLPEVWVQDRHNGQTRLTYNPEREIWSETIRLPVGNMPLKFLVDGQQHITSDLPLAPEEDGELVNYVTVMPPLPPQPMDAPSGGREHHPPMHSASTWLKEPGNPEDPSGSSPPWTNEIPIQLIHAQREEEEWNEHKSLTAEQRKTIPIPPMPLHPHPPLLPRHLDKPVLGTKAKKTALASAVASTPGRSKGKDKDKKASGGRRSERDRTHGPSPLSQDTKGGSLPESLGLPTNTTSAILVEAPHGDDDAVLPVPSHVVLHHLGTSAIRDGVIAVCDTVRYKKKYITTVFYKPMYTAPDPYAMPDPSLVQPLPIPNLQQPPPGSGQLTPAVAEA